MGLSAVAAVLGPWTATVAHGAVADVPVDIQTSLLAKVARHDRNMEARAVAGTLRILVARRSGSLSDEREAELLKNALGGTSEVGGLPHQTRVTEFTSADALAKQCSAGSVAIVWLTSELAAESKSIAKALTGANVLSVSTRPDAIPDGIVLGFDLIQGRPKILVNLPQARAQNVMFRASLLKIVKVIQ